MIYVRVRGSSKKAKGSPAENRQIFIRFRSVAAAEKFFASQGFEKREHSDGTIFVACNMVMKIQLGSSADLRFPRQDFLVADILDYADPGNVTFVKGRQKKEVVTAG